MEIKEGQGIYDKGPILQHKLFVELFKWVEKITDENIKREIKDIVIKLNAILLRIDTDVSERKNVNFYIDETRALADTLKSTIEELSKTASKNNSYFLNFILLYTDRKIWKPLAKLVKS